MLIYQTVVAVLLFGFCGLVWHNLRHYAPAPSGIPPDLEARLFVLIPVRDEIGNIAACLERVLAQDMGKFTLLVLDDGSEDGTDKVVAGIAARDSRVELLRGRTIEPGWAGKVWACSQLGEEALSRGANWLLFLDADTRAQPALFGAALAYAQSTGAGMVSTFPYQATGSFWEQVALPMLHFLIITFLPVRMVWTSPLPQLVAACGQFELFSADAYRTIGGHASIPKSF